MPKHFDVGYAKPPKASQFKPGKFFEDAGNVMGPTHSRKKGIRYRYYASRALTEGRKSEAGAIARVAADDVESKIVEPS
jgi:site-specific DNA recombinase